jgi:nucleoside-diphosphate-sugar epimerase
VSARLRKSRETSTSAPPRGRGLDLLPGRQNGPGADSYLDTTRLARDTGFAPTFDIAAAVADYAAWRADDPR